jgi:hypothetical protein
MPTAPEVSVLAPSAESATGVSGGNVDRSVRVIEIRELGEMPIPTETDEPREKKRGWWRRLME